MIFTLLLLSYFEQPTLLTNILSTCIHLNVSDHLPTYASTRRTVLAKIYVP